MLFKFDVCKSIEKINQRQVIITTGKDTNHKNKIGFILWPENSKGEFYKTDKRNDAFISTYDFNYIMDEFKSVFPLKNPWNNIIEKSFDACGHNFFDNKTCRQIIERISNINHNDEKVQQFLKEVIAWFNDKLEYADYITVYGNL